MLNVPSGLEVTRMATTKPDSSLKRKNDESFGYTKHHNWLL